MRTAAALLLLLLLLFPLGCTGLAGIDELEPESPEPGGAGFAVVPDALDSSPPSRARTGDPCAGAEGHVAALCGAESFDEGCVGFSCARTASRTAVECLLEAGFPTADFVALTRAKNPVTRAYARSALLRRGALEDEQIDEALADDAIVETRGGCFVDRIVGSEVAAVARRPPRAADAPFDALVDRWTHAYGCRSEIEHLEDEAERSYPRERARLLELEARLRAAQ